jgi:hypothetical protein
MPLQATSGAASYDGFGGGVPVVPNYIEDVFSTYLYTGNGSTQTITNGIDLSTKGGLVWIKSRSNAYSNIVADTVRGAGGTNALSTNLTNAAFISPVNSFSSTGFEVDLDGGAAANGSGATFASWTFRKQPKFFDVVTWTGDGANNRAITHALGSTPACIILKSTSVVDNWFVYHRSLSDNSGDPYFLKLNSTAAADTGGGVFGTPTSTTFTVRGNVNANGSTYVAYLFAHDAGGFGLTGTDNVISCGSLTMDGSGNPASVTLGYEPQLVIAKRTDAVGAWYIEDNMRGLPVTGNGAQLYPNTSGAEAAQNIAYPNATGFTWNIGIPSATYIYIAIRRGPMKVPTTGTSVFSPITSSAATGTVLTTNFPVDMQILGGRTTVDSGNWDVNDRLRGVSSTTTQSQRSLATSSTGAEKTGSSNETRAWSNTGFQFPSYWGGLSTIFYNFKRAPSFMDVVCYTGTGVARTVAHNLGVVPELFIEKCRNNLSAVQNWSVYAATQGATKAANLNTTGAFTGQTIWSNTAPTASVFSINGGDHSSGDTYVAYLFATCAGVSKVGSYTGNGSSQTIACGFTAGARFVLIKRTDSTGDWYVWDTARGIVAGNDPHLSLNTTAAEVTTDDTIDTDSTGFVVNQVAATNVNVTSATYIFLAIA